MSFFADIGGGYRVVDTDYTSYTVIYSCEHTLTAGIAYSEASWVLTRDQIEDGSADFTTMMSTVDSIYADKVPEYDHLNQMRTTQQGTANCKYFTD